MSTMSQAPFERSTSGRSTTFVHHDPIVEFNRDDLGWLREAARLDPLGRARVCLHRDPEDRIHEMVIVFCAGSYTRPHRHLAKSETFHVVEGELDIMFFDDSGEPAQVVHMGAWETGSAAVYRMADSRWHTVIPRSEIVILHEITNGPFRREDTIYPDWAPREDDQSAAPAYFERLRSM